MNVLRVLTVAIVAVVVSVSHADVLFPNYVASKKNNVRGIVADDIDDDGDIDIITGNHSSFHGFNVLLNTGDGTFAPPFTLDLDTAYYPAIGDFDEDGCKDVALTHFGNGKRGVTILLGNCDGTFNEVSYFDTYPDEMTYAVAANFNGDDHVDVLVLGGGDGLLLTGNGHGGFTTSPLESNFYFGTVDDFNGDGALDYASYNSVYLGNGDGTFQGGLVYETGETPYCITSGFLNDDVDPDIVASNYDSDDISILIGNGDGTFQPEVRHDVGEQPLCPAIADFNEDGINDVAVTESFTLSLLLGTGEGAFAPAEVVDTYVFFSMTLAVADFDEDGHLDIARGRYNTYILYGDGNGPKNVLEYSTGDASGNFDLGDLNGNGRIDVAVVNTGDVAALLADGAASFAPEFRSCVVDAAPPCPAGNEPTDLAIAEMTGDAHPDVAVADKASNSVSILAGDGAGGFDFMSSLGLAAGSLPEAVAIGDLDHDNEPDVVVVGTGSDQLGVFLGNGDGTFVPPPDPPAILGTEPSDVALALLDADADLDVVVANSGSGDVTVLLGDGDGTFSSAGSLAAGPNPKGVRAANVDGDSILDLAVADNESNDIRIFPGAGDGTFGAAVIVQLEDPVSNVDVGDVNGDGVQDLVSSGVRVHLGLGGFTFAPETDYVGGGWRTADLDLDGRLDVVGGGVTISLNRGGPDFLTILPDRQTVVWPSTVGAITYDVYRGDVSGLPAGYGYCMTGLDPDPRDTFFVDADLPASGDAFFYLIEVIDADGPQGIGETSAEVARVPTVPCP